MYAFLRLENVDDGQFSPLIVLAYIQNHTNSVESSSWKAEFLTKPQSENEKKSLQHN